MNALKTIKKSGLVFLLPLLIALAWFLNASHTLAAPSQTDVQKCAKTLKFIDIAHITCQAGDKKITFVDKNPTDDHAGITSPNGKDYVASSKDYAGESSSGAFCQDNKDYINFNGSNFGIGDAGHNQDAFIQLYYAQPGKSGCQSYSTTLTITDTSGIAILLTGGTDKAASLKDVSSDSHSLSGQSFARYQAGAFDPKQGVALYASGISDLEQSCDGEILAVYYTGSSGTNATEYDISGSGKPFSEFDNLVKLPNDTGCGVDKANFGLGNGGFSISPAVSGISGSLNGQNCDPTKPAPSGYDCQCTHDETGGQTCILVPGSSTASADGGSGSGSGAGDSACVTNSHTGWEWAVCPIIEAVATMTDKLNNVIQDQLDFNVNVFLTGQVHSSWAIVKDIATTFIVILMLVMVISQAISAGPFDAYTVRKILPKLVVAVIFMQISWQLCIYLIGLANDAGHGIADLITAPFGGPGNLTLPGVLHHLSGGWAGGVSAITLAGFLLAATTFADLLLPGIALIAFTVGMSVLVALASVLMRNMLIIGLVIFSPIGFVAWTLTSTQTYWKMWKDNFTKLLLLFPLMMGLIYAGRVFAYIAGNVGKPGPLDLMMVLIGFFGPYFFLPKAFKWGGTFMAQASNAIASNGLIKKANETGKKEIGMQGWLGRRVNQAAKDYNPEDPNFAMNRVGGFNFRGRNFKGVPISAGGNFFNSLRAGRFIPTKRSGAVMMQRGDEHNSKEEAIAMAKINRVSDKARTNGTVSFRLEKDQNGQYKVVAKEARGTGAGKAVLFRFAGSADTREAGMADDRALRTSSWVEMGSELVPITDANLKAQIKASGAEVFEGLDVSTLNDVMDSLQIKDKKARARWMDTYKDAAFVRMYDTPRYNAKVNSSEDLYPLPLGKFTVATPHITDPTIRPGETVTGLSKKYSDKYNESIPHQIARSIETFQGGYIDEGNIGNQSEAELKEFVRLAEQPTGYHIADEFAGLLSRMADGSPGGLNTLSALASNVSLTETMNALLSHAKNAPFTDLHQYVDAAKAAVQGGPAPAAVAPAQQPAQGQAGQAPAPGPAQQPARGQAAPAAPAAAQQPGPALLQGTIGQTPGGMSQDAMRQAVYEGTMQAYRRVNLKQGEEVHPVSGQVVSVEHIGDASRQAANPNQPTVGNVVLPTGVRSVEPDGPTQPPQPIPPA